MLSNRLEALYEKHQELEQELCFLVNSHPHVQEQRVKIIKKQKLLIKDELQHLETVDK
tara:strand:- start:683 stop:856 length:174 start_codon:yes stop_codon:yes gene_type:complete